MVLERILEPKVEGLAWFSEGLAWLREGRMLLPYYRKEEGRAQGSVGTQSHSLLIPYREDGSQGPGTYTTPASSLPHPQESMGVWVKCLLWVLCVPGEASPNALFKMILCDSCAKENPKLQRAWII